MPMIGGQTVSYPVYYDIVSANGQTENPTVDTNAGGLGNYDDQASWNMYNKLVDISNAFNSAEAQKTRDWNQMMRDTQVSSYMKQLKENGINPILAVQSGFSGGAYPSSATGTAYSGSTPYSNSSKIDAAIINAIGSIVSSTISSALKLLP